MTEFNLPRVASRLFDAPLMIYEPKLEQIIKVLEPRLFNESSIAAEMQDGKSQREIPSYVLEDVAVVPIHGTLVRRGSHLNAMSGLSSYEAVLDTLVEVMEDDSISSVLLDIDSGGGEVTGCFDLVDAIYSMRGTKPIWAIANECACSAAYAIASAADRVVLPRTAIAGSIGVLIAHIDQSAYDAKQGLKYSYVTAGQQKAAANPHQKLNEGGRAALQYLVDQSYEIFVDTVARNRGISAEQIRETEAGIYAGEDVVTHGLADAVMSFDEVLEQLIDGSGPGSTTIVKSNSIKKGNAMTELDVRAEDEALEDEVLEDDSDETEEIEGEDEDDIEDEDGIEDDETEEETDVEFTPDDTLEASANALETATLSERARTTKIIENACSLGVSMVFAQQLIQEGTSVEVALEKLIDKKAEESPVGGIQAAHDDASNSIDSDLPIEDQCAAEWKRDPKIREEFGTLSRFTAYRKNTPEANATAR